MATGIPDLDVLETPWNKEASRTFARDPGLGNPNFTNGASAEANAYRSQATANSGPPRPAGLSAAGPQAVPPVGSAVQRAGAATAQGVKGVGGAAQRAGGAVFKAVRSAPGGAGGAIAGAADTVVGLGKDWNVLNDESIPWTDRARIFGADLARGGSAGAGTWLGGAFGAGFGGAAGLGVGAIPGAIVGATVGGAAGHAAGDWLGDKLAPAELYRRYGYDPQRQTIVGGTPRLPGYGSVGAPGQDVAQVRKEDMRQAALAAPAQPIGEQMGPPNLSALAPPGLDAAAPGANITRTGNSYTGAPGISGPVTINGRDPRGGYVAAPGLGAGMATPNADAVLAASTRLNQGAGIIGPVDYADRNQEFNDTAALRSAMARTRTDRRGNAVMDPAAAVIADQINERRGAAAKGDQTRAGLEQAGIQAGAQRYDADSRERVARDTNRVSLDDALRRDATTRRGQDVTALGQQLTAKTAGLQAALQQRNADRTYQAGRDDAAFAQREKNREAVAKQIESMIPPGADGKPDTAAQAQVMAQLNAQVGEHQRRLQAQLARTPDRQDVKDALAQLEKDPYGSFDQRHIRQLVVGSRVAQVARDTATGQLIPWGTSAAKSTSPVVSLAPESSWLGTDYVTRRADGSKDVIPRRNLKDFEQDLGILAR